MKLQQLPLGARFEYEGRLYVKTGPLTAASEEGGQTLIPRYAVLHPVETAATTAEKTGKGKLERTAVLAAFDDFYRTAEEAAGEAAQDRLAEARRRFLAALS